MESQDGSISLDRAGSLIVEFAPINPGSGTNVGNRSYQWDKKQVLTLIYCFQKDFSGPPSQIFKSSAFPASLYAYLSMQRTSL